MQSVYVAVDCGWKSSKAKVVESIEINKVPLCSMPDVSIGGGQKSKQMQNTRRSRRQSQRMMMRKISPANGKFNFLPMGDDRGLSSQVK